MNTKTISYSCAFFFLALIVFAHQLQTFPQPYFDEIHYIRAARDWLSMAPVTNLEHPPLGKYLIAFGIKFFGDNPIGWRSATLFFGALSVTTIFLISDFLFVNTTPAIVSALLALTNFWLLSLSRIAMIEVFLISFLLLGIYFFLKEKYSIAAIFLGCAFAVKWSALFMIAPMAIMLGLKDLKTMLKFGVIILAIYFTTFIPYMFVTSNYKISFFEIFSLPLRMYELQKMVPTEHPYKSEWYTWPLMLRPMWLEFKVLVADPFVSQGVMLLANPLQIFLGALSVIYLTLSWKKQNREIQKLLILFFSAWLIWGISPRKLTFFYYFFPSAMLYSFFIPEALRRILPEKSQKISLGILVLTSFILFLLFYPVIAGTPITGEMRTSLMWLSSWN